MLAVLLGAVGAGPLLLYGLSATSALVISDLRISEAQFGLLATTCFACATIGTLLFSRFADRRSDGTLLSVIFVLALSALVFAGSWSSYIGLIIAAGLAGLAQSFPNGVTNRILIQRVSSDRRIGWVGVKQSGVQVSQLVASLTFPFLATWVGWRGAAFAVAFIPLILLVFGWHSLRISPLIVANVEVNKSVLDNRKRSFKEFFLYPGVIWRLAIFGLLSGIGVQATNIYTPLFAVRDMNFSLMLGGLTAAVAGAVGVCARVGWAYALARGASAPALLLILATLAFVGACAVVGASTYGSATALWVAVVIHGTSALGVSVVLMSAVIKATPAFQMASASGIVTAGMFAGFTIGPVGMGFLVSSRGGFTFGWMALGAVYAGCMIVAVSLIRLSRPSV